ncbi:hypothetical protein HDU79_008495 [Rhizoclosmatium sp. JEL0117]|nr:hypothetical protein HDU79_008495 [Rhizoclosmatium sp. JEL0117]
MPPALQQQGRAQSIRRPKSPARLPPVAAIQQQQQVSQIESTPQPQSPQLQPQPIVPARTQSLQMKNEPEWTQPPTVVRTPSAGAIRRPPTQLPANPQDPPEPPRRPPSLPVPARPPTIDNAALAAYPGPVPDSVQVNLRDSVQAATGPRPPTLQRNNSLGSLGRPHSIQSRDSVSTSSVSQQYPSQQYPGQRSPTDSTGDQAVPQNPVVLEAPKKRGFLSAIFGGKDGKEKRASSTDGKGDVDGGVPSMQRTVSTDPSEASFSTDVDSVDLSRGRSQLQRQREVRARKSLPVPARSDDVPSSPITIPPPPTDDPSSNATPDGDLRPANVVQPPPQSPLPPPPPPKDPERQEEPIDSEFIFDYYQAGVLAARENLSTANTESGLALEPYDPTSITEPVTTTTNPTPINQTPPQTPTPLPKPLGPRPAPTPTTTSTQPEITPTPPKRTPSKSSITRHNIITKKSTASLQPTPTSDSKPISEWTPGDTSDWLESLGAGKETLDVVLRNGIRMRELVQCSGVEELEKVYKVSKVGPRFVIFEQLVKLRDAGDSVVGGVGGGEGQ